MNNEIRENAGSGGFFRWRPAAWLRVTGADAATFLQGQLTNDLRGLAAGGAVYGLWLNQKGKVLADSFVVRGGGEEFWVGSYFSTAAAIRERLEAYVIADDVIIEDATVEWAAVSWLDGAAPGEVPAGVLRFAGRRGGAAEEWVFPSERAGEIETLLEGTREVEPGEMERRRIAAGVPAVPAEIGPGELPNEGGLEADAISYTKGCYLGQEVMARLKTMGQVRRRLMRVRGAGAAPAVPAELAQEGKRIGELRSVAGAGDGFVGLALLTLMNFQAERPMELRAPDGTTRAVEVWIP